MGMDHDYYKVKIMNWKKLGLLFSLDSPANNQLYTHTTNAVPMLLHDDVYRIFFSSRDIVGQSNVSFFDYDFAKNQLANFQAHVSLTHGVMGDIDELGISIGCLFNVSENTRHLYYMAWQNSNDFQWQGKIAAAALQNDLKTFSKLPNNHLIQIDAEDKLSLSYPFLLKDEEGYHVWYGSTETWHYGNGEMLHVIKYAFSPDMQHWTKLGCCIEPVIGVSQAFSRPCVIRLADNDWHMWYSYRGNKDKYKIGYAHSLNGKTWQVFNNKKNVIDVATTGWDSEMVCYPYVFQHKDKLYMLYNGNGHGKTGIGLAICENY